MRLTESEKNAILTISRTIYGEKSNVYLFGSRVDDNEKGGDMDLYIETDNPSGIHEKLRFLVELENCIGEQKIDVIVKGAKSPAKEIHDTAKKTGIVLCD